MRACFFSYRAGASPRRVPNAMATKHHQRQQHNVKVYRYSDVAMGDRKPMKTKQQQLHGGIWEGLFWRCSDVDHCTGAAGTGNAATHPSLIGSCVRRFSSPQGGKKKKGKKSAPERVVLTTRFIEAERLRCMCPRLGDAFARSEAVLDVRADVIFSRLRKVGLCDRLGCLIPVNSCTCHDCSECHAPRF